ncbi:MFS transporter [Spongiactinospora rosea]|uniref:MFS transporter n=1 Tax=Spongiactinospora rosea TaxID=2248750 RepID=UPI0018F71C37|nr:MFS transporter [Spongiactinospora rosea]
MSSQSAASYAAVLRAPLAARTFSAALVGRLSYGIVFLSLVLAFTKATGSYTMAGGAIALFGLASSLLSPLRAQMIDRYGIRRALPPMAITYALLLALLAALTWRPGTPGPLLWSLAGIAGAFTPPLGPIMRTLWSDLLPDSALLQRAYSLDTVAEELLYVTGPLIAGSLTGLAHPSLGVLISAVLMLTGSLAVATSPAADPAFSSRPPSANGRWSLLAGIGGVRRLLPVTVGVGMCLGSLSLFMVAFAERHAQLAAVAWVEAALAAGSAVGGLAYGAVSWRLKLERRLPLLATGLALSLAAAGFAPNIGVLSVLVGIAGLFLAPTLTTAYMLADQAATADSKTQAGAWINTAFNAGSATGSASAGLLIERLALTACFAIGALPPLLGALAGMRKPRNAAAPFREETSPEMSTDAAS